MRADTAMCAVPIMYCLLRRVLTNIVERMTREEEVKTVSQNSKGDASQNYAFI